MTKKFRHHPKNQSCLFKLKGLNQLSKALMVSIDFIEGLSELGEELYVESEIPKNNNTGMRLIENPHVTLKSVQARISRVLTKIEPPEYLFNPVRQRSAILNAAYHRGAKAIWTVDVRQYFSNTTPKQVFEFFHIQMECCQDVALLLTNITTRYNHLPTGAPTSPILAFYANRKMWDEIEALATNNGLKMSLYMDDLTISGGHIPIKFKLKVISIVRRNDFVAHKQMFRFNSPTRVTGPMVVGNKIDAPNKHYKKMRLLKKEIKNTHEGANKENLKKSMTGLREYTKQIRKVR